MASGSRIMGIACTTARRQAKTSAKYLSFDIRRSVIAPTSPLGASHRKYFRIVQTAWKASFRPIFFPSSYVRPW